MKLDLQLLVFAKTMRSNATDAENLMWQLLRAKRFSEDDAERTKFLEALGLKVVRYWNHDVLNNTESVLGNLWNICFHLKSKSTSP
ncbi:endonuclease domain-containing protein [Acinetobacter ursingii]|uniref:endonuclease domain-containing protein n=1 Tax=Acinetobacter ursingii TaxID=108980 RepID=UPI00290EB595|nr:DUF559 domain-containing protein [Acinetobacter ursingii]